MLRFIIELGRVGKQNILQPAQSNVCKELGKEDRLVILLSKLQLNNCSDAGKVGIAIKLPQLPEQSKYKRVFGNTGITVKVLGVGPPGLGFC